METNVGQGVVPSGSRDSAEFLSFPWVDRCMVHLPGFQREGVRHNVSDALHVCLSMSVV